MQAKENPRIWNLTISPIETTRNENHHRGINTHTRILNINSNIHGYEVAAKVEKLEDAWEERGVVRVVLNSRAISNAIEVLFWIKPIIEVPSLEEEGNMRGEKGTDYSRTYWMRLINRFLIATYKSHSMIATYKITF